MSHDKTSTALLLANNNYPQFNLLSALMMTTMLTGVVGFPAVTLAAESKPKQAQTPAAAAEPQEPANAAAPKQLPKVTVEGARGTPVGYISNESSLAKLPRPLLETPKSITALPRQLLNDQAATTVRDALRNVPGISIAAGEGGFQGDSLTIRGFTARSDFFLDGMRDFGSYHRDPFNMETIEVLKGPESILFGRGSTGGVVNQSSKQTELASFNHLAVTGGSDLTRRAVADINAKLDDRMALRLNIMGQDGNVAARDGARNRRYGFAPSLAMGLGAPTRLTAGYFHQSENNIPDYGLPWFFNRPADVARENFYGFKDGDADFLRTDVDIGTVKFEHDVNPNLTLHSQLRLANYQRNARITEARVPAGTLITAAPDSVTVTRQQIAADSTETFVGNQTGLTARFDTAGVKHTLVTGIEAARETSDPTRFAWSGVPGTNLASPNDGDLFSGTPAISSRVKANANSVAFYAVDTLALTEKWDLTSGIRWDRIDAYYRQSVAPAAEFARIDDMVSWRGSLVYKPVPNGSLYVTAGTSFNPSIEQLALSAANANVGPEESMTYEAGIKWAFLDEHLNANFAVFRDEKTNARTPDPNNTLLNILSGEQRVDGFEIGLNGHLTPRWQIFAGYAFLVSEVVKSSNGLEQGNQIGNAPKHTFNLWTTYDLPHNFQAGGGMKAVASRNASSTPNATTGAILTAPGYVTFDAMVKYQWTEKASIQLNAYNLGDKYYFDQIHPGHVVPGAGRAVLLTTSFSF